MREFRDGKIVKVPDPVKVSDQKLRTINLIHDTVNDTWFSANLGWVSDIHLAAVVSDSMVDMLKELAPRSAQWKVVKFVELPF